MAVCKRGAVANSIEISNNAVIMQGGLMMRRNSTYAPERAETRIRDRRFEVNIKMAVLPHDADDTQAVDEITPNHAGRFTIPCPRRVYSCYAR